MDEGLGQVDGDGVHPDHHQRERPLAQVANVDQEVKQGEHQGGIRAHHADESACPQFLIDRENMAPKQPDHEQYRPGRHHVKHFPTLAHAVSLYPFSGQHAHQSRGDSRNEAEQAFRIEIPFVEPTRQQQTIDVTYFLHKINLLQMKFPQVKPQLILGHKLLLYNPHHLR